jgi:branched-chain amino acid transport system substrate-binding protein
MPGSQTGFNLKPLLVLCTLACAGSAIAQQATIKIGLIAPLEGALALSGQDAIRGTELALDEIKYMIGNKKIVVLKESSNGRPDVALSKAKKLIEQDNVDILIGPLAGGEGLAIKEYAKTKPNKTFVQGTSAAQELTLKDPAPNLYRFTGDGAQWQAGLGNYAYDVKGYRKVVSVGDDYAFPYSQVAGFISEFCPKGGRIPQRFWAPLGTKDYNSIIAKIPDDIDAIYLLVAGADAVNFLTQYQQAGGKKPVIAGTATVDRNVLSTKGNFKKGTVGVVTAGPITESNSDPMWVALVAAYQKKYPDGLGSPSFNAMTYYINTKASMAALAKVNGDLSDNHKKFRDAMQTLKMPSPLGMVELDANRQGIVDNFLSEVAERPDGSLYLKMISKQRVNQTLGLPVEQFLTKIPAGRDAPACQ